MKRYYQNKFEQNIPKLSELDKLLNNIQPSNQSEINNWELSKEQIDFWQSEVKRITNKILALTELKNENNI